MSTYEYQCVDCKHQFRVSMTMDEHEKKKRIACPECKSSNVRWHPTPFYAVTSKKS
jgi:putative FmdB family regulatory protein